DLGIELENKKRRDTFLGYDSWGNLTNASFASFTGDDATHTYQYTRPFDNTYQYDALGRRTVEAQVNRDGKVERTDIYYDGAAHDIQEVHKFITDSQNPDQVTRYV